MLVLLKAPNELKSIITPLSYNNSRNSLLEKY